MGNRNRYLEAFKENFNVVGLTTAAALSAALLNPLPLLVALVAEAAYLVFVPDSKWYEARLSKLYDADIVRRRERLKEQVFPMLRPEMQNRFTRLEQVRHDISAQSPDTQSWFCEVVRKLDFLLEKFLQFASKEVQFRTYLLSVLEEVRDENRRIRGHRNQSEDSVDMWVTDNLVPRRRRLNGARQTPGRARSTAPKDSTSKDSTSKDLLADLPRDPSDRWVRETIGEIQAHYDEELNELRKLLEDEQDPNTKAVLEKRLDVLQRRREFVGKIGRIQTNLNHQLGLLEDTFGLISDEIRARPPEQVLADIEDVVSQTNTMTQVLEEVAPYEQMLARLDT